MISYIKNEYQYLMYFTANDLLNNKKLEKDTNKFIKNAKVGKMDFILTYNQVDNDEKEDKSFTCKYIYDVIQHHALKKVKLNMFILSSQALLKELVLYLNDPYNYMPINTVYNELLIRKLNLNNIVFSIGIDNKPISPYHKN